MCSLNCFQRSAGFVSLSVQVERDGLTAAERTDIEKYADIGWNLSEGIHMSSPEVFKNTPYSINAAEKVELYRWMIKC